MTKSQSFADAALRDSYNDLSKAYESLNQSLAKYESSSKGKNRAINQRIKDLNGAIDIIEKKIHKEKIKNQSKMKKTTTAKAPAKRKKRVAATTMCRKVIHVPGINKTTGKLLKGWKYVHGVPVKVTATAKKKPATKAGLKKPSTKQSAAQTAFKKNAALARKLVASGKAKNLKSAWAMLKK